MHITEMTSSNPPSAPTPSHKRAHSNTAELPPLKKLDHMPRPYLAPLSHIFVVTTEQTGPYLETETHTVGTYASYQDAFWKAKGLENKSDEEGFELIIEGQRTVFGAKDDEGDGYGITIERMKLLPAGSEKEPVPPKHEVDWEEEDDQFAEIKAQQSGGDLLQCKGAGCREPLCYSCWPQREKDWEKFSSTHTLPESMSEEYL